MAAPGLGSASASMSGFVSSLETARRALDSLETALGIAPPPKEAPSSSLVARVKRLPNGTQKMSETTLTGTDEPYASDWELSNEAIEKILAVIPEDEIDRLGPVKRRAKEARIPSSDEEIDLLAIAGVAVAGIRVEKWVRDHLRDAPADLQEILVKLTVEMWFSGPDHGLNASFPFDTEMFEMKMAALGVPLMGRSIGTLVYSIRESSLPHYADLRRLLKIPGSLPPRDELT